MRGASMQTCELYMSIKPPRQHLFVAAASLYFATGVPQFRAEADYYWDVDFATFIYNWNNVAAQVLPPLALALCAHSMLCTAML